MASNVILTFDQAAYAGGESITLAASGDYTRMEQSTVRDTGGHAAAMRSGMKAYLLAVASAAFFIACGSANAQQAVLLYARGVANWGDGLATPGDVDKPVVLATDVNGHMRLLGGGGGGGDATAANQVTGNNSLAAIDAGIPAGLGQTTMAASMPVAFESKQSAIPVTLSQGGNAATVSSSGALSVDGSKLRSVHGATTVPTTATTYTANQSLGGLITAPVFESTTKSSGTLARISIAFKGANQTPSLKVYVWEAAPDQTGTPTCANAAAFNNKAENVRTQVDVYSLVPTTSTNTTMTFAALKLADPVMNRDTVTTMNLYACIVTETSVTTAENDAEFIMRVVRD